MGVHIDIHHIYIWQTKHALGGELGGGEGHHAGAVQEDADSAQVGGHGVLAGARAAVRLAAAGMIGSIIRYNLSEAGMCTSIPETHDTSKTPIPILVLTS